MARNGMIAHVGFWLLLIWGKKDEEIGWIEAVVYAAIWLVALALAVLSVYPPTIFLVVSIVLDIILLFRSGIAGALVR